MNILKNFKKGFTLVELLIVLVIIAILAALLLPKFKSQSGRATTTANLNALKSLDKAVEMYIAEGRAEKEIFSGAADGLMSGDQREALVTQLIASGHLTPNGTAAQEAEKFRAFIDVNTVGVPQRVTVLQYRDNDTNPYVVNLDKTLSGSMIDGEATAADEAAAKALVTATLATNGTDTTWKAAFN